MKRFKLTKQEKAIENALVKGEFVDIDQSELEEIAQTIASRRKEAVLNIRVNNQDLKNIKRKAKRLGVKYQTLISELLHRYAA